MTKTTDLAAVYEARPWLSQYEDRDPQSIVATYDNMLDAWTAALEKAPDFTVIEYFDGSVTMRELDEISDALAVGLLSQGVESGDRVAIYLQNIPQYAIALLGIWKAGAIAAAINPMNRQRELTTLLNDSGAKALICLQSLYKEVAREVLPSTPTQIVITTSELRYQTENDPRVFADSVDEEIPETVDLEELIGEHRGQQLAAVHYLAEDAAVLTYTSGTTGIPKGAINTHGNLAFNTEQTRVWSQAADDDSMLAIAPFFHITGLVVHLLHSLVMPIRLVMTYRFTPSLAADQIQKKQITQTVAPITAYIALLNSPDVTREHLASMRQISSGGAPVPPRVIDDIEKKFGHYVRIGYGLTETTSTTHTCPRNSRAPIDEATGAISVGVPVFNTFSRVVDDEGNPVPVGEVGEIEISGPQVISAYWGKPKESEESIPGGVLKTGDVGFMDENGWFYLVDRKKDMISASGYKVWPREVEDVLYSHPAVREAAVVGVPDDYRGETVKAVVSLMDGSEVTTEEIVEFCKSQMAKYKYPRIVEIVDELPKNAAGKILRRELRG